jgi:hypothetical protein
MRNIFVVQLVVGVAMLFWGVCIVRAMPYLLLDQVLTPDDLLDAATYDRTLQGLLGAFTLEFAMWLLAGFVIIGLSILGLAATRAAGRT